VESWSIEEDELASFYILNAENSVSRGLGFFGDDGNFVSEDVVE
jgi:hypothetical protein